MNVKGLAIQERDIKMLKIIAKYGAISTGVLEMIYGKDYYFKRIKKLRQYKYINKVKNCVYILSIEGERYLDKIGVSATNKIFERYANASYVGYMLDKWEFMGSKEAKLKYNLNRGLRMLGLMIDGERVIVIYKLPDKIGKVGIESYKKEFTSIKSYDFQDVVILSNSEKTKELFGVDSCGLTNLYIMPDEDISLMLINAMANTNTSEWVVSQLYDIDRLSKSYFKMYDYESDDEYIFNMIDYNIAKIDGVLNNIKNMKEKLSKEKEIICICLEAQLSEVTKMLGKESDFVTFKPLPNEKLLEIVQLD